MSDFAASTLRGLVRAGVVAWVETEEEHEERLAAETVRLLDPPPRVLPVDAYIAEYHDRRVVELTQRTPFPYEVVRAVVMATEGDLALAAAALDEASTTGVHPLSLVYSIHARARGPFWP